MIGEYFALNENMLAADEWAMRTIAPRLAEIERVKEQNQLKLLRAFMDARVSSSHFGGSTGYGYGDAGREKLEQVFARAMGCEAALVRHQFMSGTHALAVALFGILRPGDVMLCASGRPYDTLAGVIGIGAESGLGSLADFGVRYRQVELLPGGGADLEAIEAAAPQCALLYLQRSRGYAARRALSLETIEAACAAAKRANPGIVVLTDNCYGEFVRAREPAQAGADLIAGSLIKNPGGGIAPTGGYIAGKAEYVSRCAQRFSAPGVGAEVGSVPAEMLRQMYLGLYFAPEVTAAALKTGVYASAVFGRLGCGVSPLWSEERDDLITAIGCGSAERLTALCKAVQAHSPVDCHLVTEPWPMPGYDCDVIMASGSFTLGSSIELSCDAPMREPYTAYLQGGLSFAAGRAAVLCAAQAMAKCV